MQQQVPASFLGFQSVIIKNLRVFVNCTGNLHKTEREACLKPAPYVDYAITNMFRNMLRCQSERSRLVAVLIDNTSEHFTHC